MNFYTICVRCIHIIMYTKIIRNGNKNRRISKYMIPVYWAWVWTCVVSSWVGTSGFSCWRARGSTDENVQGKIQVQAWELFLHRVLVVRSVFHWHQRGTGSQAVNTKIRWRGGVGGEIQGWKTFLPFQCACLSCEPLKCPQICHGERKKVKTIYSFMFHWSFSR